MSGRPGELPSPHERETEPRAKSSERRNGWRSYQAVLDAVPQPLAVVNAAGAIRFANQAMLAALRAERRKVAGTHLGDWLVPLGGEWWPDFSSAWRGAAVALSGSWYCRLEIRPLARFGAVVALLPSGDEAQGDSQLLGQLIHDLKNSLSAILCYAEALPDTPDIERAALCERLQANARNLVQLLDDFGVLSDLRSNRIVLCRSVCDWPALVEGVVTELDSVADAHEQRLVCEAAAGALLYGDRSRLEQAVRSLLLEALREAPVGAAVRVVAGADVDGAVLRVRVPDRSGGASAAVAEAGLLDSKRLAIELAQRIIALHGGTLSLDAQEGSSVLLMHVPSPAGMGLTQSG